MNESDTKKINARGASGTHITIDSPVSLSSDWTLLTLVYSGTTLTGYINGQQVSSGTIAAATDNGRALLIGSTSLSTGIDEIRLGEVRRTIFTPTGSLPATTAATARLRSSMPTPCASANFRQQLPRTDP